MAGELAINVDTKSLERSPSGSITGGIWVQVGGVAFPEEGWSDFVVVILTWWSDALCALMSSPRTDAELLFMDGPFALHAMSHQDRIYLAAVDRRCGENVEARANADIAVLRQEILRAAGLVMEAIRTKNWTSRDIDELVRAMEALNRTSISQGDNEDGGPLHR